MFRVIIGLALAASATLAAAGTAQASDAKTIRIEPRAFYGATISLESGVRVYRPLPPTSRMIVNPNQTPLNLSITEETRTVNKTVRHYGTTGQAGGHDGSAYYGGGFVGSGHKGRRDRKHRGGIGRFPASGGKH